MYCPEDVVVGRGGSCESGEPGGSFLHLKQRGDFPDLDVGQMSEHLEVLFLEHLIQKFLFILKHVFTAITRE
jgi:hypothetical protein